jgi:hypothetical protein
MLFKVNLIMSLQTLVEKVRKEEVALFVGSGLSLYAGYRGAWELKELIYKQVESYCKTETDKSSAKQKNLSEISELLIRYAGSRNALNKVLLQEYKKEPKATHLHDRLSRIPHFEHIFTTNYDTLLEDSMIKRCYVIGSTNHFPAQNNRYPKVYKLHGDVNNLDEIIIATRDYSRITSSQKDHMVWNRLKDVSAYKDILFIGHSYEDSNIWEIYHDLEKHINDLDRKKYMVCPGLTEHQQNYLESIGFIYINMTAEAFINHLYPKLIEHAIADCETQQLSLSTFERFLNFNDKNIIIKTEDQKIRVEAILEVDGSYHPQVNFTVSEDVHKQFMRFQEGSIRKKTFTIAQKDLVDFSMHMSGFKFPLDASTMGTLKIMHIPEELTLNIESEDGQHEYSNLQLKRYQYADGANMEFHIHNAGFLMCFKTMKKGINVTTKLNLPKFFNSVKEALEVITFITYLFSGKKLDFYVNNQTPFPIINRKPLKVKFDKWEGKTVIQHLQQLKFLERKFKIKFSEIALEKMTKQTVDEVNFLYEVFSNGYIERSWSKVIILPGQLTRYSHFDNEVDLDLHKNIVIETPRIFKFYDSNLPRLFFKYEIIEGEFIKYNTDFAIKSKIGKIRHRVMLENEFMEMQQGKNEIVTVDKFIQEA